MLEKRQSNFEALRVLSIFFILCFHCVFHSGIHFESFSFNVYIIKNFYFLGELGVNFFLITSGFFQINKKFKFKKLVYLFFEFLFYQLLSFLIRSLFLKDVSILSLYFLKHILHPTEYWFYIAYCLLYLFSPFVNSFLKQMQKKKFLIFLGVCIFFYSFYPTLLAIVDGGNTENYLFFNRFIWAIIMYSIGAYISLFSVNHKYKKIHFGLCAFFSFVVMTTSILLIENMPFFNKHIILESTFFWQINTVPMLVLSISVFCLFSLWNVGYSYIINRIATTTLGIYLLTDGELRTVIWVNLFDTASNLNYNAVYSVLYIVGVSLLVLIIGSMVDFARQLLVSLVKIVIERMRIISMLESTPFYVTIRSIFDLQ